MSLLKSLRLIIILSCQKSCQHYSYVNIVLIELWKSNFYIAFRVRKSSRLDRSKRLSERKHKTFLQLNEKDFKNPSGDHQRTNIIWEVQNNVRSINRQINVITTNTFNCGNYEIKLTWTTETKTTSITVDSGELNNGKESGLFWQWCMEYLIY